VDLDGEFDQPVPYMLLVHRLHDALLWGELLELDGTNCIILVIGHGKVIRNLKLTHINFEMINKAIHNP
jgi:hypothetical protein